MNRKGHNGQSTDKQKAIYIQSMKSLAQVHTANSPINKPDTFQQQKINHGSSNPAPVETDS